MKSFSMQSWQNMLSGNVLLFLVFFHIFKFETDITSISTVDLRNV